MILSIRAATCDKEKFRSGYSQYGVCITKRSFHGWLILYLFAKGLQPEENGGSCRPVRVRAAPGLRKAASRPLMRKCSFNCTATFRLHWPELSAVAARLLARLVPDLRRLRSVIETYG